jgi:hypothetical protein
MWPAKFDDFSTCHFLSLHAERREKKFFPDQVRRIDSSVFNGSADYSGAPSKTSN